MTRACARHLLVISLVALLVAGCGGGGSGTIGGSVSGLGTGVSVVLQDNGGDTLTVASNGGFEFATALDTGVSYAVAVTVQPTGQSCTVSNGSGTVDSSDDPVDNVSVACTTLLTLSGTVTGLAPGTSVTLSNGQILLPVATNGTFSFPGTLTAGAFYDVTVTTQPALETCVVTNGSGTVPTAGSPAIVVTCS
jgi:hypothetical protein